MSDGDAQGEVVTAPNVKWAQRKDRILLTIECENCEEPKLRIENVDDENEKFGKLSLAGQGTRNGKACAYDLNLEVFGELVCRPFVASALGLHRICQHNDHQELTGVRP